MGQSAILRVFEEFWHDRCLVKSYRCRHGNKEAAGIGGGRVNIGAVTSSPYQTQMATARAQRQAEFQQLGQDLQSGNVAAAQQDFTNLTKSISPSTSSTTAGASSTQSSMAQEFQKLGQDLESGNVSAAQTDYTQIQQSMQQAHTAHGHHHHHGSGGTSESSDTQTSSASNILNLLTNTATAAASAYGNAGLTGLTAGASLLSALA